ncbi:hypothetical protein M0804_007996 [Polistes exclamans]|nr:hypothetical protein M0804_007996 [Polistes exclamans]
MTNQLATGCHFIVDGEAKQNADGCVGRCQEGLCPSPKVTVWNIQSLCEHCAFGISGSCVKWKGSGMEG